MVFDEGIRMVRSHLGSKCFAASSRQSHHNRTAMFQAIMPYEDEFSPTNPPHDIEPFYQYYKMRENGWNLKHAKTDNHTRRIAWEKQEQARKRMFHASGASGASGSSGASSSSRILGIFQMPPPPPLLPAPHPPFEIPPAPPATSGQNEAKLSEHIEKQSEQIEKQTEVIKKQSEQIEQQTQLIKKQCELYEELREKQAELMMETMDEMRKMKECIEELKTMVVAQKKSIDDLHSTLRWHTEWLETIFS